MKEDKPSLMSILGGCTPVTLVGNDKIEGRPLVTPLVDDKGAPKVDNHGRELGSIRLEQQVSGLNGTFFNMRRRVAFIAGVFSELEAQVKIQEWQEGVQFPGKILVTESLAPFYKNQQPKINPSTGEVISIIIGNTDYPVYQHMTYTPNIDVEDKYIRDAKDVADWLRERNQEIELVSQKSSNSTTQTGVEVVEYEDASVPA